MNVNIAQGTSPEQAQPRFDTDPSLSGLSFFGVLRSEFAKLLALRTTFWLSLISVGLFVLIGGAAAASLQALSADDGFGVDEAFGGISASTVASGVASGGLFAMLLLGALGVIAMTTEFTSGAVRSSLAAVPRRGMLYLAKAVAVFVVVAAVAVIAMLFAHVVAVMFADALSLGSPFTDSDVAQIYGGTVAGILSCALFGLGLGALLRSSAGGIVLLTVMLFVVQMVLAILWQTAGQDWLEVLLEYEYNSVLMSLSLPGDSNPSSSVGAVATVIWTAVPFGLGWLAFAKRDV